jgi:hypothetical protein
MPAAPCSSVFRCAVNRNGEFQCKEFSSTAVDFICATVQVYPKIPRKSFLAKSKPSKKSEVGGHAGP